MSLRWVLRNLKCKAQLRLLSKSSPFSSKGWDSYTATGGGGPLDMYHSYQPLPTFSSKVWSSIGTQGCHAFCSLNTKIQRDQSSMDEPDPFSLVADELSVIFHRLQATAVSEVPKLAPVVDYFFKQGIERKRFYPTVPLLMASVLKMSTPYSPPEGATDALPNELHTRQRCIAEVASLVHASILDDVDTRCGIGSLNFVMGNKLAVLAGDFLLSRAWGAIASLENIEVSSLFAKVLEHVVTGEAMQMTATSEQSCSMEYYMQKIYYKTASLISNSCKASALLMGQTTEVSSLACDYGHNLLIDDVINFTGTSASLGKGSLSNIRNGIITAPILFAMDEFPQLRAVVEQGFHNPSNVNLALDYLAKSQGIQRSRELAAEHAKRAVTAIVSLPEGEDDDVRSSRWALVNLTHITITGTK